MSSDPDSSSYPSHIIHPFSLEIPPTTYCPGSDVKGEVLLEFPQVHNEQIDEVVVEFRGMLKVSAPNTSDRVFTEKHEHLYYRKCLWKRGSTYPPPNSHILRLQFRFHPSSGPTTLPWHDSVSIVYYVEVVSLRPTTFWARNDKRIRERLVVVSRGDPTLCTSVRSLKELLVQGEPTWKTTYKEQHM